MREHSSDRFQKMVISRNDEFIWNSQFTAVGLPDVPTRMDVMSHVMVTVSHEIWLGPLVTSGANVAYTVGEYPLSN
jgi:hypothetical protein